MSGACPGTDTKRCPSSCDDGTSYGSVVACRKGIPEVQSSHAAGSVSASFSDPTLIASAGLVPLVRLAERHGLPDLISQHVDLGVTEGANPAGKA